MKLTVYNGSGRGKRGNSAILIDAFIKGFSSMEGCSSEVFILMEKDALEQATRAFPSAEHVLLVFPMYTDTVPGIVKDFIERLAPYRGRQGNPAIGFIIHCGFPEIKQLRALEAYLKKLTQRLGCEHTGTVLMGNSEGLRTTSPQQRQGLIDTFETLGKSYAQRGCMDQEIIKPLAQPERFSGLMLLVFKLLSFTPFINTGWNKTLKVNGAYEKRFAQPYLDGDENA